MLQNDKLLSMGYSPSEILVDCNNEYDIYLRNLYIKCFEWDKVKEDLVVFKKDTFKSVSYSSRLISGVIERKTLIVDHNPNRYEYGIFENDSRKDNYESYNSKIFDDEDFLITGYTVIKYLGNKEKVINPESIRELSPCLFWDNQFIKEVVLPDSLVNISGDTFYNCGNLEKITITRNVKYMGNNPFAGCSKLILKSSF